MAAIDYERAACDALGLKHEADNKQGELYHFLGHFEIGCTEATIRAIAGYHRSVVHGFIDDEAQQLSDDIKAKARSEWRENFSYLTYGQYLDVLRHLASLRRAWESHNLDSPDFFTRELIEMHDPEIHTPDATGYAHYLQTVEPRLGKFLTHKTKAVLPEEARLMHTYAIGRNGSGKTTLLKTLIHSYLVTPDYNGGMVILDPHGDMAEEIARWREFKDNDRLVYIDPALSTDRTPGLNPLDLPPGVGSDQYAQELASSFEDMLVGRHSGFTANMISMLQYTLRVLIEEKQSTLLDLLDFLSKDGNERWLNIGKKSSRQKINRFFTRNFTKSSYQPTKDAISSKIDAILAPDAADALFLGRTTFDLEQLLNDGKVVLFNLSKGAIGEAASEALGRFIIGRLHGIALRRENEPRASRVPIHAFVDECQNFIGGRIGEILAEDRKYGLHLTLANQFRLQLDRRNVREAVLRNTHVKFVGVSSDDIIIAKELGVTGDDLRSLERGEFYCQSGNGSNPSVKINVRSDVADNRNDMTEKQWQATVKRQLELYYRPLDDVPAVSSARRGPRPLV